MLELKDITYEIQEDSKTKKILDNVSCVFDHGTIAITGHNGSGKSTLTKIIMGIVKPTSGKVFFNGLDITNLSIDERAKLGLNYAFQQPVAFKGITVKDLIDLATNKNNSVPKACEYLSKVGICAKEYLTREFDKTLSGGEQKRIELALALAKDGECYIFDEPEAGIDLWSFDKLNTVFKNGKLNIVVSHQEKLLKQANKVLVLDHGKVKEFASPNKILDKLTAFTCEKIGGANGIR